MSEETFLRISEVTEISNCREYTLDPGSLLHCHVKRKYYGLEHLEIGAEVREGSPVLALRYFKIPDRGCARCPEDTEARRVVEGELCPKS